MGELAAAEGTRDPFADPGHLRPPGQSGRGEAVTPYQVGRVRLGPPTYRRTAGRMAGGSCQGEAVPLLIGFACIRCSISANVNTVQFMITSGSICDHFLRNCPICEGP